MKKLTITFFLALLCACMTSAQELRPLAELIQNERQKGTALKTASDVFTVETSASKVPASRVLAPQDLTMLRFDFNRLPEDETFTLELPMEDRTFMLDLQEMPDNYMDFQAMTESGEFVIPDEARHYRGIISGDDKSLVAITFFRDQVMGLVANAEGNFVLGKDPNSQFHMLYNDRKLKEIPEILCDYKEPENALPYTMEELSPPEPESVGKCVNMHFTTEYDIYQHFGTTNGVDNYVRGFFHQVAIVYFNDGVDVNLSGITIYTSNDPFTATNTADLLNQYEAYTGNFNGNLSQLLTFRDVGGGRANTDKLCNFWPDNRKSVSEIYTFFNGVPAYSWTVYVVAHEFGHTIGSRHTHDCVWNWLGNSNQAIDHCGSYEGYLEGEDYGGQSCLDINNPRLPDPGTVMSYCHLITSVDFSNGFQGQVANLLNNKVDNASCLTSCNYQCPDLCDIDAQITSVLWGSKGSCEYKFIAKNPLNPMCMNDYDYEWRIEGVLPVVSTAKEFIYDFSNFNNGTYDVTLTISWNGGLNCTDTVVKPITINCGINNNPSCPSASGLYIAEAEPCIDYMVSFPYSSGVSQIVWKYNIHGVPGEQTITTTSGPGPYSVPFSLPGGHNYDYHYLWVHADITLTNGNTCRRSKSRLLSCPGGGGGGGSQFVMIPNPTNGTFEIQNESDKSIVNVFVRNVYGNLVTQAARGNDLSFDLSGALTGMYFVEVIWEDGYSEINKLLLK